MRAGLAYETGGAQMPHGTVNDPHLFVSIDSSGIVSITAHGSEMGVTEFLKVDGRVNVAFNLGISMTFDGDVTA